MLELLNELKQYLNSAREQDIVELRKFRKDLHHLLQTADKQLDAIDSRKHVSRKRCPKCNSRNIKVHAKNPVARFRCMDCGYTFSKSQSPLYYRRKRMRNNQNVPGILEFIIEIHQTDKSISIIKQEFNISLTTYYAWRKTALSIFPQLEESFARRRKKAGKLSL